MPVWYTSLSIWLLFHKPQIVCKQGIYWLTAKLTELRLVDYFSAIGYPGQEPLCSETRRLPSALLKCSPVTKHLL